jgi:hypothetical protein
VFHLHRWVGITKNSSHLSAYEDGTDSVFRNVGIQNSGAKELLRRKHTTRASLSHNATTVVALLRNTVRMLPVSTKFLKM